ncbi:hypothetical protein [Vulcanisaeta sp. JCM 16161]|uniref:hypothetical protein n=1 Tax=Vulcanisaeta sp. JCM 16161 TaxID=1295372 RepID=UPI000AC844A9|nr:hypothetical protein [Vulcanisaeta sp. JCM 16161]
MVSGFGYFERFDDRTARMYRFLEILLLWSYRLTANMVRRYVKPPARVLEIGPAQVGWPAY